MRLTGPAGQRREHDADRLVRGSAQARVPVDPPWPNVASEQPGLPAWEPIANPRPRGINPSGL